ELYLHGGMNISPYKKKFQSISSKKINFYQNYNATEGFFGLQSENDAEDMLLMLDYGIYYEFISKENWDKDQPLTLNLEGVELNTPYEVVISTNGGLWRYRLEDTVIFTSVNPFKIKVIGRTKQFINIAGEELMIQHVESAIKKASEKCLCSINEYTVAPVFKNVDKSIGFHYWLIEFCEKPADLSHFISILDLELQKVNIDYKSKRENNYPLNRPVIKEARKNTFYKWLESQNKLGGQNKILRINETKDKIDEILEMENTD
ncbi:MAG: GH3 auxin-responsive promoter family protein, partial [Flavobacteriales bacterium]